VFALLASLLLAYVFAAFYLPLALMFLASVLGKEGLLVYVEVLSCAVYAKVIFYSAYIALLTTLAILAFSLPAAYYLAFHALEKRKATPARELNALATIIVLFSIASSYIYTRQVRKG